MTSNENETQQSSKKGFSENKTVNSLVILWAVVSFGAIVVLILGCIFGHGFTWLKILLPDHQLEVISAVQQTKDKKWELVGSVIDNTGNPVIDTTLWAIATDSKGNRFMPPGTSTNTPGQVIFDLGPNEFLSYGSATSIIEVHATRDG